MLIIIIEILLSVIAGVSNSIMDTIKMQYKGSDFDRMKEGFWKTWFNPNSWELKWEYVDGRRIETKNSPWYYLGLYNPGYKEKFKYSSTLFVGITNAWHFFQSIMLSSLQIGILLPLGLYLGFSLYGYLIIFLLIKISFSWTFELFWNKIWKN